MAAVRQSSVPGRSVPVARFIHAPGTAPVAVTHLSGRSPVDTPATDGTHTHDFLVLCYAHRADGTVEIDSRSWIVTDGALFVLAPGQVVSFTGSRETVMADGWVVWFPADAVRPAPPGACSSWRSHPLLFPFARGIDRAQRLSIPAGDRAAWVARFAELEAELQVRRDGCHEAALAHLTLLLVAAARLTDEVAGLSRATDEPLLAAVFDIIERRYHEPISLADVAAELALTTGHLTTVVRRKTGRTVQQWITQRRLRQARVLLAESDLTVAAISHRVDWADVSYFIKRFRADQQMTPAQWRGGHRAEHS